MVTIDSLHDGIAELTVEIPCYLPPLPIALLWEGQQQVLIHHLTPVAYHIHHQRIKQPIGEKIVHAKRKTA